MLKQDTENEGASHHSPALPATAGCTIEAIEVEVDEEIARSTPAHFSVCSHESAAWVVRRITAARRYAEQVRAWAALEQHRAEREEQRLIYLFGRQVEQWASDELKKLRGTRRSIALPGGIVGFRAVPARVVIDDEKAVFRWARRDCPSAIVVSERILKTPINEHIASTGEIPEGVTLLPAEDKFYIR